ncbi:ATP synthase F0 subunit B [Vampirovibrio chlorellavorus]|uniref:ATP synthase F0 subunit B n=1 Tax=Vampirovibrio chlorellavorus TaxID=758823 RepID=UPI0026EE4686|nr:ATP synthase F0 subunit B [Vampirovibrio chlorellavorus]
MLLTQTINPFLQQASVFWLQAHHESGEHPMTFLQQLEHSNVFNVLLVVLILGFVAKKLNLFGGIDAQRQKLAAEVEAVELQKKNALAQLEEAKRKTGALTDEINEILTTARTSAEAMSNQILSDARNESTKIVENAKKRMELERRAAIKDLERRLLSDALADARTELAAQLNAADQKRSVESFLDELSQIKGGQR